MPWCVGFESILTMERILYLVTSLCSWIQSQQIQCFTFFLLSKDQKKREVFFECVLDQRKFSFASFNNGKHFLVSKKQEIWWIITSSHASCLLQGVFDPYVPKTDLRWLSERATCHKVLTQMSLFCWSIVLEDWSFNGIRSNIRFIHRLLLNGGKGNLLKCSKRLPKKIKK